MARYRNIEISDELARTFRHMEDVDEHRETLQTIQGTWDNLALLGEMSEITIDISNTRKDFYGLSCQLLNQLGLRTLEKRILAMQTKAQVVIDVLVRNLLERTADVGFLALDEEIRVFIEEVQGQSYHTISGELRAPISARLAEYVTKYSIYSDIVLMSPDGNVLARLDETNGTQQLDHPAFRSALNSRAYVEHFGPIVLFEKDPDSLIYLHAIPGHTNPNMAIGVLCLSFRFEDEMRAIYRQLLEPTDWSIIALVDNEGKVVSSSDTFRVPTGAMLPVDIPNSYGVINFGVDEYLATKRTTHGYQGYFGPGWSGYIMVPLRYAFDIRHNRTKEVPEHVLRCMMDNSDLFGESLREIVQLKYKLYEDISRSVWNGSIHSELGTGNSNFTKALLWEVSKAGLRTDEMFSRPVENLQRTIVSSILSDTEAQAALAIELMDRNLYERANDCRWWALTSSLRRCLEHSPLSQEDRETTCASLGHINSLYTMYTNLIVFDRTCRVVGVSNPTERDLIGERLKEGWLQKVIELKCTQDYVVSDFEPSGCYQGRPTYVYGANILDSSERTTIGGIGLIFDAEKQFSAILGDALPKGQDGEARHGTFAVFVDRSRRVISCSDNTFTPGSSFELKSSAFQLKSGETQSEIMKLNASYYAVGSAMSNGYREYKSEIDSYKNDVLAMVFVKLCTFANVIHEDSVTRFHIGSDRGTTEPTIEIASFRVGKKWVGLPRQDVVEALGRRVLENLGTQQKDGFLVFRNQLVPIFRMEALIGTDETTTPLDQMQIVIVSPNNSDLYGIMVDALGDIPEVRQSRILNLPEQDEGSGAVRGLIYCDTEAKQRLLLLNTAKVVELLTHSS